MLENSWFKKEKPLLGLTGMGGGVGSNLVAGAAVEPYSGDIAVAHYNSPYISVYPWDSGFGTKYTDPSTLPTGIGIGVAFSPA